MTYTPPSPIIKPYCNSGAQVAPPLGTSTTVANQETGFPPSQATPLNAGGIPVDIEQFNGLLNFYTQQILAMEAGVKFTFDPNFSAQYGGYPAGVILYCASNNSYQISLVANNTANFVSTPSYVDDGINWLSSQSIFTLASRNINIFNAAGTFSTLLTSGATANNPFKFPPNLGPTPSISGSQIVLTQDSSGNTFWQISNTTSSSQFKSNTVSGGGYHLLDTVSIFGPGFYIATVTVAAGVGNVYNFDIDVGFSTSNSAFIDYIAAKDIVNIKSSGGIECQTLCGYVFGDLISSVPIYLLVNINSIGGSGFNINSTISLYKQG